MSELFEGKSKPVLSSVFKKTATEPDPLEPLREAVDTHQRSECSCVEQPTDTGCLTIEREASSLVYRELWAVARNPMNLPPLLLEWEKRAK